MNIKQQALLVCGLDSAYIRNRNEGYAVFHAKYIVVHRSDTSTSVEMECVWQMGAPVRSQRSRD
jgi:hypothetical protein